MARLCSRHEANVVGIVVNPIFLVVFSAKD